MRVGPDKTVRTRLRQATTHFGTGMSSVALARIPSVVLTARWPPVMNTPHHATHSSYKNDICTSYMSHVVGPGLNTALMCTYNHTCATRETCTCTYNHTCTTRFPVGAYNHTCAVRAHLITYVLLEKLTVVPENPVRRDV